MINRFKKVTDNLYRGSGPSPHDVKWLKDNFGIKKIVSLDEKAGKRINRACKLLGIKHVMLPLEITKHSILTLLKQNIRQLLTDDGPVYVHCHYGKDRTGLVVAMFKCKYMGMNPDEAIHEAKTFGFGVGVPPQVVRLYEKIIRSCKSSKDENSADIVSNTRETKSDNRSGVLDEAKPSSFAPGLDASKTYPIDIEYNPINDQSPTRQNYQNYKSIKEHDKEDDGKIPQVGQYNNDAGVQGFGPTLNPGGFIYD
jgi:protein tyrosine phosphatase (PTP) superfamily phosphohydrolase (DUF442 family)